MCKEGDIKLWGVTSRVVVERQPVVAIGTVGNWAKDALNSSGACSVLALDVKNAFASVNWSHIKGT